MSAYVVISVLLLLSEMCYIAAARRFGLVDIPGARSSHSQGVVRGGGIIFYLAVLAWFILSGAAYWQLFSGVSLLAAVSFADDIREVSVKVRLVAQFVATALILWQIFGSGCSPLLWTVSIIVGVGIINAFNFMDGINGSIGLYSLVVLASLTVLNASYGFADYTLLYLVIVAAAIFCIFNLRRRALCFAGDVGSIVMGAVILYLTASLIFKTGNLGWLVLIVVYGADTFLTIVRRIALGQNILRAHRLHAYQLLTNEMKFGHLSVTFILAVLQAAIDIPALFFGINSMGYLLAVAALLAVVYFLVVTAASRRRG